MSVERWRGERVAEHVCPIYRKGDRVLVNFPKGYYEIVVEGHEIREGKLWLCGEGEDFAVSFPASRVIRRLASH